MCSTAYAFRWRVDKIEWLESERERLERVLVDLRDERLNYLRQHARAAIESEEELDTFSPTLEAAPGILGCSWRTSRLRLRVGASTGSSPTVRRRDLRLSASGFPRLRRTPRRLIWSVASS